MNRSRSAAALAFSLLILSIPSGLEAKKPAAHKHTRRAADIEAATRLQIFLDRANFSPGKLDGHYGDFTWKALALYRQSRGEQQPPPGAKTGTTPDLAGVDVASVQPVYITYTVTGADLQTVGKFPSSVTEQAKLKRLPYGSAAEAMAEKFHCDIHFLEQLNPGKTKSIKAGNQLLVPNVEPFELGAVKHLKPGSEITAPVANDIPDQPDDAASTPDAGQKPQATATAVKVDTKTNMLSVFEGENLIAAYPVTIGSAQTASPIGEWKVRGVAKLPKFRYDKEMLKHGKRSANFHMLPPGPNNQVGVVWIALNKKGIGLHGTAEPDSIGRSASHGCVRLANWDIVRLAQRLKTGTPVSIH